MDSERHEELTEQATQALAAGDTVRALALGDQIAAMDPEDAMARIIRAHALLAGGSTIEGFREAQIAALLEPENEDAQMVLALSAWRNRRIPIAEDAFARAARLAADNPQFSAHFAWFLANERSPKAAIQIAEEVIAKNPGTATAWAALGLAQLRMKRPVNANSSITHALSIDPNCAEARSAMVRLLKRRGDDGQADALAEVLRQTRQNWPTDSLPADTETASHREDAEDETTIRPKVDLIVDRAPYPWLKWAILVAVLALSAGLILTNHPAIVLFCFLVGAIAYAYLLGRRLRARG